MCIYSKHKIDNLSLPHSPSSSHSSLQIFQDRHLRVLQNQRDRRDQELHPQNTTISPHSQIHCVENLTGSLVLPKNINNRLRNFRFKFMHFQLKIRIKGNLIIILILIIFIEILHFFQSFHRNSTCEVMSINLKLINYFKQTSYENTFRN